ncbi:MAG TPA: bile acid:sodium symporter [Actinomycetota bacterium]|jgi:BASS family bile acid:Na+ symporter|nr:bile acid:sodium symporter [Actinomycetota bacterium]
MFSIDRAYADALNVTLWATGLALGATLAFGDIARSLRRTRAIIAVVVLDCLALPVLVWALCQIIGLPQGFRIGLLLVGMASAGPLGLKFVQLARGDAALAVSLVVILELANVVVIPAWAPVLLPAGVSVPVGAVVATLARLVVVPIGAGMAIRAWAPGTGPRLRSIATLVSSVSLVAAVLLAVLPDLDLLGEAFRVGVGTVSVVTLVATAGAGWLVGGAERPARVVTSLVSVVRAVGPALAVALVSFADRPAAAVAVVAFGLLSFVVVGAATFLMRRERVGPR